MRIVKLRTSMGEEGVTKAGQVLEVTPPRARDLISRGLARALDDGEAPAQLSAPRALRPLSAGSAGGPFPEALAPVGARAVRGRLALLETPAGFRIGRLT